MLVDAWLPRAAAATPRRVAVHTPAGSWTYAELLAVARDGAAWLARRGVGQGDRVALALPPGLAFVQALHATLLLGAVAVPVDLRLSAAERAVVTDATALRIEAPLWEGPSAPHPGGHPVAGTAPPTGAAQGRAARTAADAPVVTTPDGTAATAPRHDLDAVAVIVHTSGTTSAPRPVALTYGNFLWSALGSAVARGLDPPERWRCAMPVSHVGR